MTAWAVTGAIAGVLLWTLGAGGAQSSKPAARAERPVPFAAGETLTYDVTWSGLVTAGSATAVVREKRPSFDSVAYYIVAEGRPSALLASLYQVYYKADTLLDVYTLLPQRGSIFSSEGTRRRMRETLFDRRANRIRYEVLGGDPLARLDGHEAEVPESTHDPLSAIYAIRARGFDAQGPITLAVSLNGRTRHLRVTVGGVETIPCGIGTVRARRLTPAFLDGDGEEGRELGIWLTDDARRLPVKMQATLPFGAFVLTLTRASA
ncbi:MAG TPA: DUF3108 domain-containing protein [Vicinamibacterales bacterium]